MDTPYSYLARLYALGNSKFTINTTRAKYLLKDKHFKATGECWCKTIPLGNGPANNCNKTRFGKLRYFSIRIKQDKRNRIYSHIQVSAMDLSKLVYKATKNKSKWISVQMQPYMTEKQIYI